VPRNKSIVGEPLPVGKLGNLSYSTFDNWLQCPKKVELSKIRKAPTQGAWWFTGGTAVHTATEAYDRWSLLDPTGRPRFNLHEEWERAFDSTLWEDQERHPDLDQWRHGGNKDTPETHDRWKITLGPELVASYIKWRQRSQWTLWLTPDGEPGIELDLAGQFPGAALLVKAYVDRIFSDPIMDQLIVVDLKSGTRQPDSPLQLGVYGAGMAIKYGVHATWGYCFMNRKGELGKPYDLTKYTPEYVGKQFGYLNKAVDCGIYPAHVTNSCRMCDVSTACYAQGGEFSKLFDPDDPDWVGNVPF